MKCRLCGKPATHIFHCDDCYQCADCGALEKLCTYTEGVLCDPCRKRRVEGRVAGFKGDTSYTDEVMCPHCGYVFSDSWELKDGTYDCHDCGREFQMCTNVSVSYTTFKVERIETANV